MQEQARLRNKLMAHYETLTPLQQALLQLSSVIYEKSSISNIYNCLRSSGLVFANEPITSVASLKPHLDQLKRLKLLDKQLRCHDAILEVVTRRALEQKPLIEMEPLLALVADPTAWLDSQTQEQICVSCQGSFSGQALRTSTGSLCTMCVLSILKRAALKEDLNTWSGARYNQALSPEADSYARLTFIWRFPEVLQRSERENPSQAEDLLASLVRQLGFDDSTPIAPAVRQIAVHTAGQLGSKILPVLLAMWRKEPWQFYANAVLTAGTIAPDNKEVQALLKSAAQDSNPEVRKYVVAAIAEHESGWSKGLLQTFLHDRDTGVREYVKIMKGGFKPTRRFHVRTGAASAFNRYHAMVKAVRKELPVRLDLYYLPAYYRDRIVRELRMGIYTHDENLAQRCRNLLLSECTSGVSAKRDPFTQVVMNPFDIGWFRTLPLNLRCLALSGIFHDTVITLEPDDEPLEYALNPSFLSGLSHTQVSSLLPGLISRLLLGGRIATARELLMQFGSALSPAGIGLWGWLWFVGGKNNQAVTAFEDDLKLWRKINRKRSGYFLGLPGIFYALSLLTRADASVWEDIGEIASKALSADSGGGFLSSVFTSLKAIFLAENCEVESARTLIAQNQEESGLSVFFTALAHYWLDGSLTQEMIDTLSGVFVRSREIGLNWLAMESAELLCRTEQRTPIREKYLHTVQEETGMGSFLSALQVEEGWRRCLRVLHKVSQTSHKTADGQRNRRLIWLLGFRDSSVTLQAKEQKISARGTWTKGRILHISRIINMQELAYVSEQDKAVFAAIEQSSPYYHPDDILNVQKALPALIGHPLVFLEENPSISVEIVRGEPEIMVTRADAKLRITMSPPVSDEKVLLVRETPTRFKVIEISEAHRRIAQLLSREGLMVPASAEQEVSQTIANISSLVTVHSAIGGASGDMEQVAADSTPHVHLMPAGLGFRVEMFVKPFADGGPYIKPGIGADNLIADVGGKRMQATRDLELEKTRAGAVEADSSVLAGYAEGERRWLIEDMETCLQVLLDLKSLQEKGEVVVEWPEGEKLRVSAEASFSQLRMQIQSKMDWFEVSGQLRVDDNLVLDMKQLLDLVRATGSRFIPLGEGQFLALTQELRRRLEELEAYSEKHGKVIGLHPLAALALEDFTAKLPHLETDSAWQARLDRIRSAQEITPLLPSTFKGKLRDYQVEGYQWLTRLMHMGVGACLADDMGLGKTIQALAIILERAPRGPSLVVAPTSVCMNWVTEAHRFAPTLRVHQFGVNSREDLLRRLAAYDLLVTSYGLLYQEVELLSSIDWKVIVLDEAQAIKNIATKRSQAAMSLKGDFKIITTGTPIENHLSELWTLFNFINRGLLGSFKKFNERFAIPIERYNDQTARKRLKKLIQPFILRRTKSQVLEELPPRTDVLLRVQMSPEEAAFYEALRRSSVERLCADATPLNQKHIKILAEITQLRQAACNPRLVLSDSGVPSAKLELFGEIISELLENQHKALVFSQFVGHLSLLREYLDNQHIDYRYLDGSTPPAERKKEVDAFQAGRGDLFLISLKAGGMGLNLTAADYVIHMDPWWNPAVEDQASDRTHRIGQQRPVTVYRVVTEGTIEEKILELHQDKRDLAGSLLEGTDISAKISAEDLLRLIQEP